MQCRKRNPESGIAVFLTAMMLVFVIPIVGLAIDAGVAYVIKGRLAAACDAAALAAARSLNVGVTLAQQITNAQNRGRAFFDANFPSGTMATWSSQVTVDVADVGNKTLQVTVNAQVQAPTYFMKILRQNNLSISGYGQAQRRDLNMVMILDRSGSMSGNTNPPNDGSCAQMRQAASQFVGMFVNGRDKIGIVTFGTNVSVDLPITTNFLSGNAATNVISGISCLQTTNSAYALWRGWDMLRNTGAGGAGTGVNTGEPGALNVIVFFTDGVPNGVTTGFPIRTQLDSNSPENPKKSTCNDDLGRGYSNGSWGTFQPKFGVVSSSGGIRQADSTGSPWTETMITGRSNCHMSCQGNGNCLTKVKGDVAHFPDSTTWPSSWGGNSTTVSSYGYRGLQPLTSGPYTGKIRFEYDQTSSAEQQPDVARNQAVNLSDQWRADTNLAPIVYTIGLDGNGGLDDEFLRRLANDINSPTYDSTKPLGKYVYAPNGAALAQAFTEVASAVLRLAR